MLSSDVVTVGNISVSNQDFILVNSEGYFGNIEFDGIAVNITQGLAFNQLSGGYPTLVENMYTSIAIEQKSFAVFLNFQEGSEDSNIMFGGYDLAKYSLNTSFNSLPVTNTGYWSVFLSRVTVGGNSLNITASQALIDTGTSLLALTYNDYVIVMNQIIASQPVNACSYDRYYGLMYCNCKSGDVSGFLAMTATLGAYDFDITPRMYLSTQLGNGDECHVFIQAANLYIRGQYSWILGDVFIRGYYLNFDMDNMVIGIATGAQSNSPVSSFPLQIWEIVAIVICVLIVIGLVVFCIYRIRRKPHDGGYILDQGPMNPIHDAVSGASPEGKQPNSIVPNQARPQQYVSCTTVPVQSMSVHPQHTNL
jgi:hypothetical protein